MIGIKIQGRLGNQLFQYAYARVLSKKFNTPFFFARYKDLYLQKYFEIGIDSAPQNAVKKIRFYLRNLFMVKEVGEDQFAAPAVSIAKEQDNVLYVGYYQSEQYHPKDWVAGFKETIRVKPEFRIDIKDTVRNQKPTIVVHVRRTDYVSWGGEHMGGYDMTLPLAYYQEALALLPVDECNILFLSDDIGFVKQYFNFPNAQFAEGNSEIVDFQLLMQADYLVLANSSFSWWGAYLNKTVKRVIAPKYWIGVKLKREHPSGINCNNWTSI